MSIPTEDPRAEPDGRAPPESKPTLQLSQLEIVKAQLERLIEGQHEQRDANEIGFKHLAANIELVSSDLSIVKDRVTILESYKNDADVRATRTSARVQQASQVDLEQASALAAERVAREALAVKVDELATTNQLQLTILSRLDKITSNPLVKTLMTIIGTALATWAASKGLK